MYNEKILGFTLATSVLCLFMLGLAENVVASSLKICELGLEECESFISEKEKYKNCLNRKCSQQKQESTPYFTQERQRQENIELIKICDYGARKCESLSEDPQAFWECMKDSCNNQPMEYNPTCQRGRNDCNKKLEPYNKCLVTICGLNNSGEAIQCGKGQKVCERTLRTYWQCVYGQCLGRPDRYSANFTKRKYIMVEDLNGDRKIIKVGDRPAKLAGVPSLFSKTPDGVNAEEWVRETLPEYLITGSPSNKLICIRKNRPIKCFTNDLRSCICSDGSIPIFKAGAPIPIEPEEWKPANDR